MKLRSWRIAHRGTEGCGLPFVLAQDGDFLAPLVVTATGSEQSVFDTSLPVNLIEARDLDEKVTISLNELFQYEPGVDAISAGPGSIQPVIRGLSGERVLVLVDGIRLSEQRPGGSHAFSLDPAQVERVEVVRGPSSVLYGSDAIGGVMNFITKRADEETGGESRFSGETDVAYQSNGEGFRSSGHLRFGQGRFNGYLGGVYRDTANMENSAGEVLNSFYEGYTLWGGGNYIGDPDLDPETSWNFDLGMKTQTDRMQTMIGGFYNVVDDYIVQERQPSGDRQWKNFNQAIVYGAEAGLDYDLGAGWSTFATLSYVRGNNVDAGAPLPGIPPLKARYGLRYETELGTDSTFWAEPSGLSASNQDRTGANERQTDGYTRGDLRVGVDFGNTWSVVAAVENFTEKLYQDHLSTPWQESALNDLPGRCVKLMVKARF